jgi:hypothetical protein
MNCRIDTPAVPDFRRGVLSRIGGVGVKRNQGGFQVNPRLLRIERVTV